MDPTLLASLGGQAMEWYSNLVGMLGEAAAGVYATRILEDAQKKYGDVSLPTLERVTAEVIPQMQLDPSLRDAQSYSLGKMREGIDRGGFTIQQEAAMNRAQNMAAQRAQGEKAANMERMAARGIGGSGAELAMALGAGQAEADRNSQAGLDIGAQAQAQWADWVRQQAALAGGMRSQDLGEQEAMAAINRFNAGQRTGAASYNNALAQQDYNNRVGKADRGYSFAQDRAGVWTNLGQRAGQGMSTAGHGANQTAQGWGELMKSQNAGGSQYNPAPASGLGTSPHEGPIMMPEDDDPYTRWMRG